MELQFFGANCITVVGKGARVVVDDNLAELGGRNTRKPGDTLLFTQPHEGVIEGAKLVIDNPGEYEISDISIIGIPARAHMDTEGQRATMYKVIADGLSVLFVGHIFPELSEEQLESIGMIDVLVVPVGGNGYTLDPVGALKVIRKIEPKLVIPTHYEDASLTYPVPQQSLENAIKELGMEPKDTVAKLKLKAADISDITQLIVLQRA